MFHRAFPHPLARLALVAALFAAAGCGGARPHPAAPAPPAAPSQRPGNPASPVAPGGAKARPGYDRPAPSLVGLDTSALRGRRIVLDPGHGGRFPGAIGPTGVSEAEVNLGVALHLWGLLTDAGAQVLMTRTTDRDLTTPADSSLRGDLAARVEIARGFDPDVFVSIHHNADLSARHDLNETQAYYKLADPLASLPLAEAVNARLVEGIDVGADRLLPGNYFVVRNAPCPAMLGESSYITNPDVESRLAIASRQRVEAVSYFLGLLDYFRRGVPRVTTPPLAHAPGESDEALDRLAVTALVDRPVAAARLALDGAPVDTARIQRTPEGAGTRLSYHPAEPLTDGWHAVEWTARATTGAWSGARRDSFEVRRAPAHVAFVVLPLPGHARAGETASLTVRVLDRHDHPLARTVTAAFDATVGARMVDSLTAHAGTHPVPGEARGYARLTGGSGAEFAWRIESPGMPAGLDAGRARLVLAPDGARGQRTRTGFVRVSTPAGPAPVAGALVRGPAPGDTARTNADGYYALAADSLTAEAPGYVTGAGPTRGDDLVLAGVGGAALVGRRIVLDAAGGGPASGADSLAMLRALTSRPDSLARLDSLMFARSQESMANLETVRSLAQFLRAAGALVLLTRATDDSLSTLDRLRAAEAFGADRLVTVSHRQAGPFALVGHYFASTAGRALADRIAQRLAARGLVTGTPRVAPTPGFLVQQAGAVAVSVDLPAPPAAGIAPGPASGQPALAAYAIYLALLEDSGGDPVTFEALEVHVTRGGAPAAFTGVTLDHRWTLATDADGLVRFDGLPPRSVVTLEAGNVPIGGATHVTLPHKGPVTLALPPDR